MQNGYKYRIKWFKMILLVLSSYFIYLCVDQQMQLNAIHRETEAIRTQIAEAQQINAALKEERNALNDRKHVEKLAREELGLVKPGEIPYMVTGEK